MKLKTIEHSDGTYGVELIPESNLDTAIERWLKTCNEPLKKKGGD